MRKALKAPKIQPQHLLYAKKRRPSHTGAHLYAENSISERKASRYWIRKERGIELAQRVGSALL